MAPFETFLQGLDRLYSGMKPDGTAKVRLRILGSVALMIQADYLRGTKDGEVRGSAPINRRYSETPRGGGAS